MSWADYQTPTREIPLGGGKTGTVRGLNIEDFGTLVTEHLEAVSKAAKLYADSKKDIFTTVNLQNFTLLLARDFPQIVSEVISIAADEPSLRTKKLNMAVQLAALAEIAKLTLEDAGGLKNLLAILGASFSGKLGLDHDLTSPTPTRSPSFTGESEKI